MSGHYISNSKAWMNSDIMETVLVRLDCRMDFGNRKVILFLDNTTFHLKSLQNGLTNIELFSPQKQNILFTIS